MKIWRKLGQNEKVQAAFVLGLLTTIFLSDALFQNRVLTPADIIYDVDPLWSALAPPEYSRPANPVLSDLAHQFYPWRLFMTEVIEQGRLPLWNPYNNGGQSFLGYSQPALFSPFTIIGHLVPVDKSFAWQALARLFVAGFFTFILAREIGLGKAGSYLAMITFTFSSPLTVWLGYAIANAIVWLPALLLVTRRLILTRKNSYIFLTGLVIGLHLLGGHLATSFQMMVVWGLYGLYCLYASGSLTPGRSIPTLLKMATALLIGLGLAAIHLLPFMTALLDSAILQYRAEAVPPETLLRAIFFDWRQWPAIITTVLPQFFGTPLSHSYWYPAINYNDQTLYAGLPPLILFLFITTHFLLSLIGGQKNRNVFALRTRPWPDPVAQIYRPIRQNREIIFFMGLTIVACGISINLPLLNLINQAPVFELVNNARFRLIYVFGLALCAGGGLEIFLRSLSPPASLCKRALENYSLKFIGSLFLIMMAGSLILIGGAYLGFTLFQEEVIQSGRSFMARMHGTPLFYRELEYYYQRVEMRYIQKLLLYQPTNLVMMLPVLLGLAFLASAWRLVKRRNQGRGLAVTFILLTIFDLFLVNKPFNPTIEPEEVYPTPPAVTYLRGDPDIFRVVGLDSVLLPNSNLVFQLATILGYDVVVSARYSNIITNLAGVYTGLYTKGGAPLLSRADPPLLDLLNVKYVLTTKPLGGRWKLVFSGPGEVKVYQNRQVMPRAYIVHRAEYATDASESLARLLDESFDFRQRVIIEGHPPPPLANEALEEISTPLPDEDQVEFLAYHPNRVELRVTLAREGYLVLTDSYAPGWKAYVDGRPGEIYIANHAFRAVHLQAGSQHLQFRYEPLSFKIGSRVSLISFILLMAGLWGSSRK